MLKKNKMATPPPFPPLPVRTDVTGLPPCFQNRTIGAYGKETEGPLLVFVGAVHGNEPSGVFALEKAFRLLKKHQPPVRGRIIGLAGNLTALEQDVRFLEEDLNRVWGVERIAALNDPAERATLLEQGGPELHQQVSLKDCFDHLLESHSGPVYFLDMHTSSGQGRPFATMGDTLRNRTFALGIPVTKVLGIEEQIDGSILEYMNNMGHVTMGFEAGRHTDPDSVDRHLAFVFRSILVTGAGQKQDYTWAREVMAALSLEPGTPPFIEVRHRHKIKPGDCFCMEPGFKNFHPISKSDLLARDVHGEIRAEEKGLVLLPLYQGKGDDGFFLGRPVRPVWMKLSFLVRRLGLPGLAHWLPGIRRSKTKTNQVVVNQKVARFFSLDLFHLLGFRKRRQEGRTVIMERRIE